MSFCFFPYKYEYCTLKPSLVIAKQSAVCATETIQTEKNNTESKTNLFILIDFSIKRYSYQIIKLSPIVKKSAVYSFENLNSLKCHR